MSLATRIAQEFNNVRSHISLPATYNLLSGNLSVSPTVLTTGFGVYIYTGNGGAQSINLGMDLTTQWGDSPNETYGYLIKIKSRNAAGDWTWVNSVRGITKYTSSNTTAAEGTDANMFTLNTVAGVTTLNIGTSTRTNTNGVTYVVEIHQTTHKKTGVTNQGKTYTEHYNPDTGFSINGYEGSGLALHEVPHSLGRKLGLVTVKTLSAIYDWVSNGLDKYLYLNKTDPSPTNYNASNETVYFVDGAGAAINASGNQYIMYGWANSYLDETNKLIGNYEVGVYQGTGVAGNKVTTRGKPAWIMTKRLDSAGNWYISDNQRSSGDNLLLPNSSNAEFTGTDYFDYISDGFIHKSTSVELNASGGQYLYMVVYDNDSGSGKSKYYKATDTANVQVNNGIIPLAHGIDSNGSKNSIVFANETITGLTYTQGKNYLYKTDTGYGVKPYEPRYLSSELVRRFAGEQPDYYDVKQNKWFNTDAGSELVTNGTFISGVTTGWTAVASTLSIVNNTIRVTSNSALYGQANLEIATVIGKKYKATFKINAKSNTQAGVYIDSLSGTVNNGVLVNTGGNASVGSYTLEFVAQTTTTYIKLVSENVSGYWAQFDDISVFATDITPTTEIAESRNYLNHIVHADQNGQVTYVEELPKIEYKDVIKANEYQGVIKANEYQGVIKANEYQGKNACTAWVNFDGTTTPPTIRDSYNVSAVIRIATGQYEVYFKEDMNNDKYATVATQGYQGSIDISNNYINKVYIVTRDAGFSAVNDPNVSLHINGGKN